MDFDAIVLTGGAGRRLGGVDKASLEVGGSTLLDRTLAAVAGARRVVRVGPDADVVEQPPGGGPAAAIGAGVAVLADDAEACDVVVVLAVDMPRIDDVVPALLAGYQAPGVLGRDGDRLQHLAGAHSLDALRRATDRDLQGLPAHALFDELSVVDLPTGSTDDVDTPDDLARARTTALLREWTEQACVLLGVDAGEVDLDLVLDLAADAAHGVVRPAAPLTTYLAGLAVGRGDVDAVARLRAALQNR